MKVILLAGGISKRIYPLHDKNLIKICGKTLIEHQIQRLRSSGFKKFLIVCNKDNHEKIREIVLKIPELEVDTVIQYKPGMAGAILACENKIGDEEILIVSSNDVVSKNAYQLILDASKGSSSEVLMLGKKVETYFPGGYLEVDQNMRINSIIEKPRRGEEPSDLVNIVVHFYRNPIQLFQYLENAQTDKDDQYEVAIDRMIKHGVKMKAIMYDGVWQPIKYPWHIYDVAKIIFDELPKLKAKTAQIAASAILKGDVIIEDNVRILEHAIINGPCYIGKDTIIANNALVRNSFLGNFCTVGFGTEIARSFVGDECWFHTNYIGDCIIDRNCSFGSGAVTANLRLDEQNINVKINGNIINSGSNKLGAIIGENVRIGVNTSIMPGVKIGSNSMIGSGIVLADDVEDEQYVRAKFLIKKSKNLFKINEKDERNEMREKLNKSI
ncbi:MAG: Nucleotidyl transferase [Candidatus Peregrinibacteria bacterium GW2011_GWA2_33_10]|nr:MAG: Nucleotidyl transferase [Candidatus Peregrinibacteria bacterium GW2011_GWA2_33_10]KKP38785.1 MAG: Nucleotidyl transferase, bifunctional UDP-N-acetylglucosamine pyrophosphorylase / Glucosamine-1-phosphate N-acetyltransferase [Candidatus Peregrinibacteria bacterium GW2011_GWC2_33_13]OGJ50618.1 MAG: hypothetical protein A2229_04000 [Candidatus Peregrinibacteria bacterium RIFOXYA2_FULL_33_7]